MKYNKHFSMRETDQSEPIPGSNQVKNSAGGYVWEVTPMVQLERFLILGTEGGTYYITEKELTVKNATACFKLLHGPEEDKALQALDLIHDVSVGGRAQSNNACLFALAIATMSPHKSVKKYAWAALPKIARIGTHLFQFAGYRQSMGG